MRASKAALAHLLLRAKEARHGVNQSHVCIARAAYTGRVGDASKVRKKSSGSESSFGDLRLWRIQCHEVPKRAQRLSRVTKMCARSFEASRSRPRGAHRTTEVERMDAGATRAPLWQTTKERHNMWYAAAGQLCNRRSTGPLAAPAAQQLLRQLGFECTLTSQQRCRTPAFFDSAEATTSPARGAGTPRNFVEVKKRNGWAGCSPVRPLPWLAPPAARRADQRPWGSR